MNFVTSRNSFSVSRKVREFIINELGGTPPELLPTPEKSIKQLQAEEQLRLKHKGQLPLFDLDQSSKSKE
jgi:hypothetical protein